MVVFILNTASPWIIPERFTAPQHTRFILPPFHPTKSSLRCVGGIFLLWGTYLENFISRPNVIPAFQSTPLQNRGRNFVRGKRRSTYTSSGTLYLFCALTIRKHLLNLSGRGPSICYRRPFCRLKAPLGLSLLRCASQTRSMRFERSGRGQEPSSGHKFSILENFLSIRDFTSTMRLHFRSDLVGVALVGATPLHLLSQTALPLKSPTGAFIAALRCASQTRSHPKPCSYSHLAVRKNGVSCFT